MNQMNCCCYQTPYKSVVWGIVLPMLLGPLGVLYVNYIVSIVLLILAFLAAGLASTHNTAGGACLFIIWLVGIYFTAVSVDRRNCRLYKACQAGSCETSSCDTGKSCGA